MRRLKRYICLVGLLALLAAALTGCGFSDDSVEELFTLPRMAEEYTGLTQELETLITQGYEYASPTGGRNIQSRAAAMPATAPSRAAAPPSTAYTIRT